jgi:hypothetical protein
MSATSCASSVTLRPLAPAAAPASSIALDHILEMSSARNSAGRLRFTVFTLPGRPFCDCNRTRKSGVSVHYQSVMNRCGSVSGIAVLMPLSEGSPEHRFGCSSSEVPKIRTEPKLPRTFSAASTAQEHPPSIHGGTFIPLLFAVPSKFGGKERKLYAIKARAICEKRRELSFHLIVPMYSSTSLGASTRIPWPLFFEGAAHGYSGWRVAALLRVDHQMLWNAQMLHRASLLPA